MFAFLLGREYKLSIAEISSLYTSGRILYYSKEFLIISSISEEDILEKVSHLGGTIKVVRICKENILTEALETEGKFKYAINTYGIKGKNKKLLNDMKKSLKDKGISSRFVNNDYNNLITAQIIGEKLIKKGTDYNYFYLENDIYFGKTIWVQDIDAYSKRDFSKNRDMHIGMLPPKLSQMMINIGSGSNSIFDPFVGLGTVLIESVLMGYNSIYGSDLNEKMVEISEKNLRNFVKEKDIKIKEIGIEKLNAKFINESKYADKASLIVSEGYLGEIMTKSNISIDRINKQRKSLIELYDKFFYNLSRTKFSGNIVISFPFWEMDSKYYYLDDVYGILSEYCTIEDIFSNPDFSSLSTKMGSLLYKRDNQLVGREIFKLKLKKS